MNTTNSKQKTPSLTKLEFSNRPKLVITKELRKQIDRLHKKVGSKEWSGELITREVGKITHLEDWKVFGEAIFLNDIGSSTLTEYTTGEGAFKGPDIVELYDQFPGLITGELKNHHIHTHHDMGAFMSGIDWDNLAGRARATNYIIMLVVDTQCKYVAYVGYLAKVSVPSMPALDQTIEFVNNADGFESLVLKGDEIPATTKEQLVVMNMEVIHEEYEEEPQDWFDKRFDSVEASLREEYRTKTHVTYPTQTKPAVQTDLFDSGHGSWDLAEESKTRTKGVMEMTDAEFREYQEKGGYDRNITIREAYIWLNSAIDESAPDLDNDQNPLKGMEEFNDMTQREIRDMAEETMFQLEMNLETMFPSAGDDFYVDSLRFLNNNVLERAEGTNKYATRLSQLIDKEIAKLTKVGLCL